MSNSVFISKINDQLRPLTEPFTGSRVYGLAQTVVRETAAGEQLLPALVTTEGEITYIGLDDTAPLTLYHKANGVVASEKPNSRYGNGRSWQIFSFSNVLIVALDRKKTGLLPDDLLLLIRANLPEELTVARYRSIQVRLQSIVLNSQAVYQSEYQNVLTKLPPRFSLLAINYQVESLFDPQCLPLCP